MGDVEAEDYRRLDQFMPVLQPGFDNLVSLAKAADIEPSVFYSLVVGWVYSVLCSNCGDPEFARTAMHELVSSMRARMVTLQ